MINDWKLLKSETVFADPILKVNHIDYHNAELNDDMTFTVVDIADWVMVIPITEMGEFIIVKQFRAGTAKDTYEFCGGGVNSNEDIRSAAIRELSEETGVEYKELIHLGEMSPNPAFLSNKCNVFLALDCKQINELKLDRFEDVETVTVTKERLMKMIRSGEFSQTISLAAFSLYLLNENR